MQGSDQCLEQRGALYPSTGENWEVDPEERGFPRIIWILLEGLKKGESY